MAILSLILRLFELLRVALSDWALVRKSYYRDWIECCTPLWIMKIILPLKKKKFTPCVCLQTSRNSLEVF